MSSFLWISLGVVAAILIGVEWRRRDRRGRWRRVGALSLALAAISGLMVSATNPLPPAKFTGTEVALVTPASGGRVLGPAVAFSLFAADPPEPETAIAPDAAFVLRNAPDVALVRIFGNGVTAGDAAALKDRTVIRSGSIATPQAPQISVLTAPRSIRLGERFELHGRIAGIARESAVTVAVEAPDGTARSVEVSAASDGTGTFVVDGGVPVAPGAFEWRLRLGTDIETATVGVVVEPPDLPRVLFWESALNAETSRLRRWLVAAGGKVDARIRVSADRTRTTSAEGERALQLEREMLSDFDILLIDSAALSRLTPTERSEVNRAVRDGGLGLLVLAGTGSSDQEDALLPWTLLVDPAVADEGEGRRTRLRLERGLSLDEPVGVLGATIQERRLGRRLAVDSLGHVIAATFSEGHGQLAVSLVQDSWRWLQQGHEQLFSHYWTEVLSAIGRPYIAAAGWQLADTTALPQVDQQLEFRAFNTGDGRVEPPRIEGPGEGEAVTLSLSALGAAVYWPRRAGWHQLRTTPNADPYLFYVQPAHVLPGVQAEVRRRVTDRLVVDSPSRAADTRPDPPPAAATTLAAFAFLLIALTVLWMEERRRTPV